MSAREFRDDDAGYLAWLASHPDGYVINIACSHRTPEARVHHADCRTISGKNPRGRVWTGPYVKVCAERLDELERWAIDQVGEPIRRCGTCHPAREAARSLSTKQTERAVAPPSLEGRPEIHGPAPGSAIVEAWADYYIRFERRPPGKSNCGPRFGPAADNSNHRLGRCCMPPSLVPNVRTLTSRTSRSTTSTRLQSPAATGSASNSAPLCRRPPTVPRIRSATATRSRHVGRLHRLAAGANAGVVRLDRPRRTHRRYKGGTGVASARPRPGLLRRAGARAPNTVRRQNRSPAAARASAEAGSIGERDLRRVISAFQVHTDTAVLSDVASRLATVLPAEITEIERHLLDQRRAVFGTVPQLVRPLGKGGTLDSDCPPRLWPLSDTWPHPRRDNLKISNHARRPLARILVT
jgi:hypothetical protein